MGITRQTKSVKTLLAALDQHQKAIAVTDLVKFLEKEMNKSTVYRLLNKLMDDGVVHSFIGNRGLRWYAKCQNCSDDHHNDIHPHFQCKKCGDVKCLPISFTIPGVTGYNVDSASLLMVGVCSNCS